MPKTLCGLAGSILMLLVYFAGSMLGGRIAGLPFDMGSVTAANIVMCMISKALLTVVFVPLYLFMSVIGKQRTWLAKLYSVFMGMFLLMMVPMITPLDAGMMNVILCMAGGVLFSIGNGVVSRQILDKTDVI